MATVKENAEKIETIKANQDKILKALFGNGIEGMDEDIRNIKRRLDDMSGDMSEVKTAINNMKPVVSDLKALKTAIYNEYKLGPMGESDKEAKPEFLSSEWWKEEVMPGLMEKLVIAIAAVLFTMAVQSMTF